MQILYGNDGNNYRTLARTADVDDITEKSVLEAYLSYRFVGNDRNYSGIDKQPAALTYVTTNLEGVLRQDRVLICRNARMANYTTPSSYAHFILQDPEKEGYGENFFRLLRYSFIKDVDAASYDDASLADYEPQVGPEPVREGIDTDILKAVVGLILVKDRSSTPIRLIVDRRGDAYNARSLEIIEAIYHYLPYDLRKKYGFCTYAVPGQSLAARVKIVLIDPDSVTGGSADYLDLADHSITSLYRQLNGETRDYVDFLFGLSWQELDEYFANIYNSMNGKSLSAADYINLFKSVSRWSTQPVDQIFREWLDFAVHNVKSKSPVIGIFKGIVAKRLDNETFRAYMAACLDTQQGTRAAGWDSQVQNMLIFADMIDPLEVPADVFLDWQADQILAPLRKEYSEFELIRAFEKEKSLLAAARVEGVKFRAVKQEMLDAIDRDIEEEQGLIEERIQEEKVRIQAELTADRVGKIRDLSGYLREEQESLHYPEQTRQTLAVAWTETYREFLSRVDLFRNEQIYQEYRRQLDLAPSDVSREESFELGRLLEEKAEWLRQYRQLLIFQLCPDFIQVARKQLRQLQTMMEETGEVNPAIELYSLKESKDCPMDVRMMKSLLAFISAPDENSFYDCGPLLDANKWIVYDLLKSRNLEAHHFPLLRSLSDEVNYTARLIEFTITYMDTSLMDVPALCEDLVEELDKESRLALLGRWKSGSPKCDMMEDFIQEFEYLSRKKKKNQTGGRKEGDAYAPEQPFFNLTFLVGILLAVLICVAIGMVNFLFLAGRMQLLFTVLVYVLDGVLLLDLLAFAYFLSRE